MKEFEGKKLLILGGFTLACDIVRHAQAMGAYVYVVDYNPESPAKNVADRFELISATDVDAIVEFCRQEKIDGVTTGFVDMLQPYCMEICNQLDLPYYVTPKMLSMATNKDDFKKTCELHGVPVPKTFFIGSEIDEKTIREIEYPVFVKPLDASGSRGAGVCYSTKELKKQFEIAKGFSGTNNVIIEEYLKGREFLLDYIGVDGEFRLLANFDRYVCDDRDSAVNYANLSLCPSKAINLYYETIDVKVRKMFRELGFTDGLIFLQGHFDGKKITFYEMGSRLGGSFYNLEQKCLGLNAVDMTVRYALTGKMLSDINLIKQRSADFNEVAMSINYLLKGGDETIARIDGLDEVRKMDSFVTMIIERGVGCHYVKDTIMDKPAVTLHMVAKDIKEAKKVLDSTNALINVYNADGDSLLMKKYDSNDI